MFLNCSPNSKPFCMKKSLFTLLTAFLFSIVMNAAVPAYSSSLPSGLTTYPSTYPSPLNTVTTGSDIVVTFSVNIQANLSLTAVLLTITSGTSTVVYESKSGGFYIQGSSTTTTLVKIAGKNLTINLNTAVIQKDVPVTVKINEGFVRSTLATIEKCPLITLKYKGIM